MAANKTAEKTIEQYLEDIIASKDKEIVDFKQRLETADKLIKRINSYFYGRGNDFEVDIFKAVRAYLTDKK